MALNAERVSAACRHGCNYRPAGNFSAIVFRESTPERPCFVKKFLRHEIISGKPI